MKLTLKILLAMWLLLPFSHALADQARAFLDRNPVRLGETVRLIIEVDGNFNGAGFDPEPLSRSFEVLGTSTNSQINIINGVQQAKSQLLIDLEPRVEGLLNIPSLEIGRWKTQPIEVRVEAADSGISAQARPVFLKVTASPEQAYVQSPVVISVQLYVSANLIEGNLADPDLSNAEVQRLGDDTQFTTTVGNVRYRVIERKFAVFPQDSGVLTIPPIRFQGQIADSSRSSLSGLFRQGRRVSARSQAMDIEILPPPTEFTGSVWLPAADLNIQESWPDGNQEYKAGTPITRVFTIEAEGLNGTQLPDLELSMPDGIRSYPDKPVFNTRFENGRILGSREQRVAMVPSRAGVIELPEVTLDWWDTTTQQPRVARLPARQIQVAAAISEVQSPIEVSQTTGTGSVIHTSDSSSLWMWSTLLMTMLWIGTLVYMRYAGFPRRSRAEQQAQPLASNQLTAIRQAALNNDLGQLEQSLYQWSAQVWQGKPPMTLLELSDRIGSARLRTWVDQMQACKYGQADSGFDGKSFWKECQAILKQAQVKTRAPDSVLPPLYATLDTR